MKRHGIVAIALALMSSTAVPARADGFITPFLGFGFSGDSATCRSLTDCEERRNQWGVSIGTTNGIFGFEEDIAYAPDFFGRTPGGDNAMLTMMSNVMLIVPAGPIQPYALVGVGLMRPHVKFDALSLALNRNAFGYDIGGGVNIFFGRNVGVRGDLRRLKTFEDVTLGVFSTDKINFWRGSAGVTLRF
jgi:hypothetical protein